MEKLKVLLYAKTITKINPKKGKLFTKKRLLYSRCFVGVNLIYIVTYTHNYVIVVINTASIYSLNQFLESPIISNIIILIFLNNLVYMKKDELDML